MKSLKFVTAAITCLFLVSCQTDVYYPVYVPVEKKAAPKKTAAKPAPKPVETAEGFRAVEKPTTYSN
jgi:hypothetical protein